MKKLFALLLVFCLTFSCVSAFATYDAWRTWFPDYRLDEIVIYNNSKPIVTAEEFWDMARERNVHNFGTRLISVFQLLEYSHDGGRGNAHPNYIRDKFLQNMEVVHDYYLTRDDRDFRYMEIHGDGMTRQPLMLMFEVIDGHEELVAIERTYKNFFDKHYGIKMFDFNHEVLNQALTAIESGHPEIAKELITAKNNFDTGNWPFRVIIIVNGKEVPTIEQVPVPAAPPAPVFD